MSISQVIADFEKARDATRAEFNDTNVKIRDVEIERERVLNATPHTDDIVEVFLRGLDGAGTDFERQFSTYLGATFASGKGAAAVDPQRATNLLRLVFEAAPAHQPRQAGPADLNGAVLTYLLRDKIAEELPALVNKLCPASRSGMRKAERKRLLGELDTQLASLRRRLEELNADLTAAFAAARG